MVGQAKIDEFAIVLLAGLIFIAILMVAWTTPPEAPPEVNPTSIYLTIPIKSSKVFELNISGKLTNVTLKAKGEIRDWIYFQKNNFNVFDYEIVPIKVSVPNVSLKTYTGEIIVSSLGGEKTISVTIEVKNITELPLSSRSLLFGIPDFYITYAEGNKTIKYKENVLITKGYFSEETLTLTLPINKEELSLTKGAYIKLLIKESNYVGNLIVIFNGEEIFNRKVGKGLIELFIDKKMIRENNIITVKAGLPGWKFWMNTAYKIDIKFLLILEGALAKTFTFDLEPIEVSNFNHFLLSYYTPKPIPEIMISINNQIVFLGKPPITFFNQNISKDILGNPLFLAKGENKLAFNLRKEGTYEIRNLNLIIFYR